MIVGVRLPVSDSQGATSIALVVVTIRRSPLPQALPFRLWNDPSALPVVLPFSFKEGGFGQDFGRSYGVP